MCPIMFLEVYENVLRAYMYMHACYCKRFPSLVPSRRKSVLWTGNEVRGALTHKYCTLDMPFLE